MIKKLTHQDFNILIDKRNNIIEFSYFIENSGSVTFLIYDLSGLQLDYIHYENKNAGKHIERIDLTDYSFKCLNTSKVLICTMKHNDHSLSKKVLF